MENISTLRDGPVTAPFWSDDLGSRPSRISTTADRFKLLLLHDGLQEFGYEIADLRRACLPADTEVEILTVVDLFMPPLYLTDGDTPDMGYYFDNRISGQHGMRNTSELFHAMEKTSRGAREKLLAAFPTWKVRRSVSAELAARAVLDKAVRWQPDLVVLGSNPLNWIERRGLRRLTQRLTAEARCSVRVVRPPHRDAATPQRIMIAFDGSKHAYAALEAVRRRSWADGAEAYLVSCIEPLITDEFDWAHDYLEADRCRMETELAKATVLLKNSGLRVSTLVPIGNPAQSLVDEARRLNIESIFLGTRGLGLLGSLLTTSVSAAVASRADCSVEITRAPREPQKRQHEQRLAA